MEKIIQAFGWMLVHSLWQGLVFAIIAGILLMLGKKTTAVYRYNFVLVLFVAFIGTTAFTFLYELSKIHKSITLKPLLPGNGYGGIIPALFSLDIRGIKQIVHMFSAYFSANQPLIVLIWFIFFLFKSVKMFTCIIYNQQVKYRQVSEPSAMWAETVADLAEKLQIKKAVRLLQSGYVKMPVVVGHLKPIILIPVSLMAGLPADQIEAILLHELAHVRRNDYFVNFLQNIAEAIFFFNPGLLWISSLLREERENCCDDIAVTQTQNKIGFVQALISFKEHELYGSKYATAFPGKKNYLMRRVSRILTSEDKKFGLGEKLFFSLSIVFIAFAMATVAFGKVKYRVNLTSVNAHRKIAHVSTPAPPDLARSELRMIVIPSKAANKKMRDGISGISSRRTHAETVGHNQPEELIRTKTNQILSKKQEELTDAQRAEQDEIQAKKDEQQAIADQKQALLDQAQALKDQAQAKIDQEQAEKQQLNEADEAQAKRNEQQAQRNREQEIRNAEQAQRNEQQVKKNKEQEIRNTEQARRNELQVKRNEEQAKKNQEQALKNAARVQQ